MMSRLYRIWLTILLALLPTLGHASRFKLFDLGAGIQPISIQQITYLSAGTSTKNIVIAGNLTQGAAPNPQATAWWQTFGTNNATKDFSAVKPLPITGLSYVGGATSVTKSYATDMNTQGLISGWLVDNLNTEYAVYWKYDETTTLYTRGTLPRATADSAVTTLNMRAVSVDNIGNIIGYSYNTATKTYRPMAWVPSSAGYSPKDLGWPLTGKKDSLDQDIPYLFDVSPRPGVPIRIHQGYAVGIWKIPGNDYPTPVLWNVNGYANDAFIDISSNVGKDVRPYVTEIIAGNYLIGWTMDALKEQQKYLPGTTYDPYALPFEVDAFNAAPSNRALTRWFAQTAQQPGTNRLVITGFDILPISLGDLGTLDAVKLLAISENGQGLGGIAADASVPPKPVAFYYSSICGMQNANDIHYNTVSASSWNLQSITGISDERFIDAGEKIADSWVTGSASLSGVQHGYVLMPASIPVDLSVSIQAAPATLKVGETVDFTITVTNTTQNANDRATCVRVDFTNPPGVTIESAHATNGSCTITIAKTQCVISTMGDNTTQTLTMKGTPRPMLADRNNNPAKVIVYSTETDYFRDPDPAIGELFPYDSFPADNIATTSIDVQREGCFIATVAYDSYMAPEVQTLRHFRDHRLLTNAAGRWFVDVYYRLSPPVAEWIAKHPLARAATRVLISPIVYAVAYPKAALMFIGLLGLLATLVVRNGVQARA